MHCYREKHQGNGNVINTTCLETGVSTERKEDFKIQQKWRIIKYKSNPFATHTHTHRERIIKAKTIS